MKIFKSTACRREREITTAALPDIIFMLLFFFMVTTVLRKSDDLLKYKIPTAEQLKKIEQKPLVSHLTIGMPKNENFGASPRIEADGHLISVQEVAPYILRAKQKMPSQGSQIIILLKADQEVPMGLVSDVTQELRKANARRIVYAASWKSETDR